MTWRLLVGGRDSTLLGCCRWTLPEGPAGEGDFASMLVSTPAAGPGLTLMLRHLLSGLLLGGLVIPLSSFPTLTNSCCVLIACNKLSEISYLLSDLRSCDPKLASLLGQLLLWRGWKCRVYVRIVLFLKKKDSKSRLCGNGCQLYYFPHLPVLWEIFNNKNFDVTMF